MITPPIADSIIKEQRRILDERQSHSKKPILVKLIEGKKTADNTFNDVDWLYYKDVWNDVKNPIYTRSILVNELCFDPDIKDWNILTQELRKINEYCIKNNIPVQLAYSGGSGIHIHIYFNSFLVDDDILNLSKKYDMDIFKIVRNVLVDLILEHSDTNRTILSLDSKKISFGKLRMGSMVREYGTTRPDGHFKTLIDHIPSTRAEAQKLPLIFPDKTEFWTIPNKYNAIINQKLRIEAERAKKSENYNVETMDLSKNRVEQFPCLKQLFLKGVNAGNRYYASNSITLMAKQCGYSWTTTEKAIRKLFSACDITEEEIKVRIDNNTTVFTNDYLFSCEKFKDIFPGYCSFLTCPIHDIVDKTQKEETKQQEETIVPLHIKEQAEKILNEGCVLEYVMKQYHQNHIGDDNTGNMLIMSIATQSVMNSSGLQPKLSASSGKGKSHAVTSLLHLVSPKYILEASLSSKALFYSEGLKKGTIIFSDDTEPNDELQEVIKRSSTNFQKNTTHRVAMKVDGEMTAKDFIIPARMVWILTSVNDGGSIEYLNRQFSLGVDETPEQDNDVMELLLKKAMLGTPDHPITDDVLVCRAVFDDIKTREFMVMIPFADRIVWNSPENRRLLPQFLDVVRASAVLNYRCRDKDGDNIIMANKDDFENAIKLYGQRAVNQKLKLNDNEINTLKKMEVDKPYTIMELQTLLKKSDASIRFLFKGRDGKSGLLSKVTSLENIKETEILGDLMTTSTGNEYMVARKSKPKDMFILRTDFGAITMFGFVATLRENKK